MGATCCGGGGRRYIDECSTAELAETLARRKDVEQELVRQDGLIHPVFWPLYMKTRPIACVASFAIRFTRVHMMKWEVWGGAIRRNTGPFKGKLCTIGGTIAYYESVECALRRHWEQDLGLEIRLPLGWDHPVCMAQYGARKHLGNFCDHHERHDVASIHIVTIPKSDENNIRFGKKIGGQEACGFEWHTAASCPPESEWGYSERHVFLHALEQADKLRFEIARAVGIQDMR